jgi:hypothetical protein
MYYLVSYVTVTANYLFTCYFHSYLMDMLPGHPSKRTTRSTGCTKVFEDMVWNNNVALYI